ncbi:MAG: hypothetical protein ACK4WH_04055 [Phycisphaerales bacterium]
MSLQITMSDRPFRLRALWAGDFNLSVSPPVKDILHPLLDCFAALV